MKARQPVRRRVVVIILARRRLAALLSLLLVGGGFAGGALAAAGRLSVVTGPLAGHTVALDPGHGSIDSGASHPASAWSEKEITLDVAKRLGRLIRKAGGRAVLTRVDDWESDLPNRDELRRRVDIAVKGRAEILLSLHVDAHADSSCQYPQVFYYPSSAEGKRLALALEAELLRFQPDNYRRASAQDYFLLGCSKVPSALVELGFISHPDERRQLNSDEYRQQLAEVLLRGVKAYFAQPYPSAPPLVTTPLAFQPAAAVAPGWPGYGRPGDPERAW